MSRVWPPPLRPGDLVVAVAPSGPVDPVRLARGIELVESWGLRVRVAPHVGTGHPELSFLSATDRQRAADLQSSWEDDEVRAVWAARGGYGAQRMVDLIDFAGLRRTGPRHFLGLSDVTALHTRIGRELGQVTMHAPGLANIEQLADPANGATVRRLLTHPPDPGTELLRGEVVIPGRTDGILAGGNLTLLAADLGVEPVPAAPSLAVLEDVGEPAYKYDRILTQLLRAGWFTNVSGVVVGEFTGPSGDAVAGLVVDRLRDLGRPLIAGVPVGHGARNLAVPLGARVVLQDGVLRLA